jgi:hypothetical protein
MSDAPHPFFSTLIGITLVFAVVGPPVAAGVFAPLALFFKAPAAAGAYALGAVIAAVLGHWLMLIFAYVIGLGPAAATGLLFALWDAAAPAPWPRALVAAIIGGLVTYAVALRLAAFGLDLDMMFESLEPSSPIQSIAYTTPGPAVEIGLMRPFVMSGAIAALVSAIVANLMRLTMRAAGARVEAGGSA